MNYYPFHIGDYASATRHLSWEEDAAYRRLLDVYYTTESPLPLDLRACCRLVLAATDAQREAVRVVLAEFFDETPDGWRSARADREIAEMRRKQQMQRDKANARWHKPRQERGIADALPRHGDEYAAASEIDADAMPPTPTPTPEYLSDGAKAPSSSAAPTSGAKRPKADKTPEIPPPFDAIVDAYHEILPELPSVRIRQGKLWEARCRAMRTFWRWVLTSTRADGSRRATTGDEAMAWIRGEYLPRVRHSDWLMGRATPGAGHEGWRCDLDFLLSPKGMRAVIERTEVAA